tara:strand:- start:216 stop:962 length:747 start_codon:yes stop_codon:yes gene_type:complete
MEHLRISTMTAVGKLSTDIDLEKMYNSLRIDEIVKFVEYKKQYKGYSKKLEKKSRKKKEKVTFYNQSTIHIFYKDKIINVKLFNNGKVQMTGLKYEKQGIEVLNIIKDIFMKDYDIEFLDKEKLEINDYDIVLINSDFDIKYSINRELLHREIIDEGLYSTYEPCMYPGVNIKYYFNNNNQKSGICKCNEKCNGKGKGNGDGDCKRVTIAVFASGKIIITGGRTNNQLVDSYNFITNILKDKNKFSMK